MEPTEALNTLLAGYRKLQVIAPHPDDEVFGPAGLIQHAQAQGLNTTVHIATDGEKCFGPLPALQEIALRQARRQESLQASQILGYGTPLFWNLGDGQLPAQHHRLQTLIRRYHCDQTLWIAPSPEDGHPDHDATGQALAALQLPALYYPIWALCDPPRLARLKSHPCTIRFTLSMQQQQHKQRAAQCFVSQYADSQDRIIAPQHLSLFVANQEMYWHAC